MPDPLAPRGAQAPTSAQFVHDADHDTQGGGCLGAVRFLILWAAFVAGVAVGVLVSWAWRAWL